MEEASKTIAGEGEPVDIKQMNEELGKTDPEIEAMEVILSSSKKELDVIEADADGLLREAQRAAEETAKERASESKIDEFASAVAERNGR